jgi:hypothetical protein
MAPASIFPLAVAVASVVGWLAVLAVFAVWTRNPHVTAAPPTSELGTETPAVVNLVTGGWRLRGDAAAATVLDLAAQGLLEVEEIGPDLSLVRLRNRTGPRPLRPYEAMVYDRVRQLARDGVVATQALAEGQRDVGRWWRGFRNQVVRDGRRLGLCRRRWARSQLIALGVLASVPAAGAAWAAWALSTQADRSDNAHGAAAGVFVALLSLLGALNTERGTPAGAAAAGRWLGVRAHLAGNPRFAETPAAGVTIWGRHLAYAAALGLAGRAVRSLPIGRPADDRHAWSDYGGMWHLVRVRYRRRWPLWGISPGQAVGRAFIVLLPVTGVVFVALVLGAAFLGWDLNPFPPALAVGLLVAAVPVAFAVSDLASRATVEGQIVRLRQFQTGKDCAVFRLALDTGRRRDVVAYGISGGLFDELVEGDQVRVRVGRLLGWVGRADIITPSRYRSAVPLGGPAEGGQAEDQADHAPGGQHHGDLAQLPRAGRLHARERRRQEDRA